MKPAMAKPTPDSSIKMSAKSSRRSKGTKKKKEDTITRGTQSEADTEREPPEEGLQIARDERAEAHAERVADHHQQSMHDLLGVCSAHVSGTQNRQCVFISSVKREKDIRKRKREKERKRNSEGLRTAGNAAPAAPAAALILAPARNQIADDRAYVVLVVGQGIARSEGPDDPAEHEHRRSDAFGAAIYIFCFAWRRDVLDGGVGDWMITRIVGN